jgi:hypothetical protein
LDSAPPRRIILPISSRQASKSPPYAPIARCVYRRVRRSSKVRRNTYIGLFNKPARDAEILSAISPERGGWQRRCVAGAWSDVQREVDERRPLKELRDAVESLSG